MLNSPAPYHIAQVADVSIGMVEAYLRGSKLVPAGIAEKIQKATAYLVTHPVMPPPRVHLYLGAGK